MQTYDNANIGSKSSDHDGRHPIKLSFFCSLQVAGLETVLGTERYWALMLSLSLIPALTQYLVLPFCPESPRYLLINKAEESKAEAGGSRPRFS